MTSLWLLACAAAFIALVVCPGAELSFLVPLLGISALLNQPPA